MSMSENDYLQDEANTEIQNILESSADWQEALNSLLSSDSVNVDEDSAAQIIDKFFFNK